jgi:hypothetical protein
MIVHAYNLSIWEVEAGGLWVWDKPGLKKPKISEQTNKNETNTWVEKV